MLITLSTPLAPTPAQSLLLAELQTSVQELHRRVVTFMAVGGRLSPEAALLGQPVVSQGAWASPPRVGPLLQAFHTLRPLLPWAHAAPQAAYDAAIRAGVHDPAAPCPLQLGDAVQLVDPVTVLVAPLGDQAHVLGRPYLLPGRYWAALVADARRRQERLDGRRVAAEAAWLAGDAEAGRRLLGIQARDALRRSTLPLPALNPAGTVRRPPTVLERRADGWWVTWTFEVDAHPVPDRIQDAVGCDPGQRVWAMLADACGTQIIPAPVTPWQLPTPVPSAGWMPLPVDLGRAQAELAYLLAEAARPPRDGLLDRLLRYDVAGIEDVEWAGLQRRGFDFSAYADNTGLRPALGLAVELGPQVGCRVVRTPARLSSRRCSGCGWTAPGRGYGRRLYRCRQCGLTVDRDVNAARNHRRAALQAVGA